jgi:hypothetical protein
MAEPPVEGIYRSLLPEMSVFPGPFGGAELEAGAAGPAGLSAVEFADGSVWAVDHADPGELVSIEVPETDLVTSPLVVGAFGGDGALFLTDDLRSRADRKQGDDRERVDVDPEEGTVARDRDGADLPSRADRRRLRAATNSARRADLGATTAVGRLVVLADLSTDPGLGALARIAAASEFVVAGTAVVGGDLFRPLVGGLLDRAAELAVTVGDDEIRELSGASGSKPVVPLLRLAERLYQHADRADGDADDVLAVGALPPPRPAPRLHASRNLADGASGPPPAAGPPPGPGAPETHVEVRRVDPTTLEVRVARRPDLDRPWLRVLRVDGLVPLAMAPLRPDGLLLVGLIVVPPDTLDDELRFDVLDADDVAPLGVADAVRRAVQLGRDAARAERIGAVARAVRLWAECASAWEQAGDESRAGTARDRAAMSSGTGRFNRISFLADEIADVVEPA